MADGKKKNLDGFEFVDAGSEVVGVSAEGDVEGGKKLVHACQQVLRPVGVWCSMRQRRD